MSVFDNFSALDDLIQVIYQGTHRFVLLSKVHFDALSSRDGPGWEVQLGLADAGRWWTGRWSEDDVRNATGPKASSTLLETFAANLAQAVTKGELFIANFSPNTKSNESTPDINVTFGPTAKQPLLMTLREMEPREAAAYAAGLFFEIALNAQSRGCRLNPPAFETIPVPSTSYEVPTRRSASPSPKGKRDRRESTSPSSRRKGQTIAPVPEPAVEEIKTLRAELAEARRQTMEAEAEAASMAAPTPSPAPTTTKNAPLVNPHKKARRYKAMEFASDDE